MKMFMRNTLIVAGCIAAVVTLNSFKPDPLFSDNEQMCINAYERATEHSNYMDIALGMNCIRVYAKFDITADRFPPGKPIPQFFKERQFRQ